jgi:hypothetical protein
MGLAIEPLTTALNHPQGQHCAVRRGGSFSLFFLELEEDENSQLRPISKNLPVTLISHFSFLSKFYFWYHWPSEI